MSLSADVSRYPFTLGSTRLSESGWRLITYGDPETVEMLIYPRGSREFYVPTGYFGALDAVGFCADPVTGYDHIVDASTNRWEIKFIHEKWQLDNFIKRECVLHKVSPMWQEQPSSTTWSKTRPRDPRYRVKNQLDTLITDSQITKDDDSTQATHAVIFAHPPYPLDLEFRASASPVQGLYCVGVPRETPLISVGTRSAYGYDALMPITVCAVDSTGCTGTSLWWKMVAELRSVYENNPTGSLRAPRTSEPSRVELGSVTLWQSVENLSYRKLAAT